MTPSPQDPTILSQRIAALERAQRRSRVLLAGSLGAVSLLVLAGAARPSSYKAQKFELVDAAGKSRAELSVSTQGGSRLLFFDDDKRARLNISVQKGGRAAMVFYDSKSKARAAFSTRSDESPTWVLYDDKGQARATMALHKDGRPILFFSDEKGKLISLLPQAGSR